jgi:hypothetical protein
MPANTLNEPDAREFGLLKQAVFWHSHQTQRLATRYYREGIGQMPKTEPVIQPDFPSFSWFTHGFH